MIRGKRLRQVREQRQLSRRELATLIPRGKKTINEKTIERAEDGSSDTEDELIDAICTVLEVPREEVDGDLRMMRLPGYTQLRDEVALIWSVIQIEFSDTAARAEDELVGPQAPEPDGATVAELQRQLEELVQQVRKLGGSSDEDRSAG